MRGNFQAVDHCLGRMDGEKGGQTVRKEGTSWEWDEWYGVTPAVTLVASALHLLNGRQKRDSSTRPTRIRMASFTL